MSVVVPAYNEERCLPDTLRHLHAALTRLVVPWEIIVVDNDSEDATAQIAAAAGARVVVEREHNIGRVRNAGANVATGDVVVFVDADTRVPSTLVDAIVAALDDPRCIGGAVAVRYDRIERRVMRWYLSGWAFWSAVFGMAQGAAQFCRRSVFAELGGYDDTIYMGEDIEFYWRLQRRARAMSGTVQLLAGPPVVTSGRRFNRMGVWKTFLLTHPVVIRLAWRRRGWWRDWYERAVR